MFVNRKQWQDPSRRMLYLRFRSAHRRVLRVARGIGEDAHRVPRPSEVRINQQVSDGQNTFTFALLYDSNRPAPPASRRSSPRWLAYALVVSGSDELDTPKEGSSLQGPIDT